MMRIFKPGGAISVFLVIILVPCLVITFLFVDLSRVELARSMVASSADMALNSLCANYDEKLNEYYGLVASCQNIDEFYEKTESYFKSTLTAAGLGDEAANNIVSYVLNDIDSEGAQNVIRVKALEDSVSISEVENANLGKNQALLKENIVEFMKYRAPVLVAGSLIELVQSSGADIDSLSEAAEDGTLADSRDTFAETEGALSSAEFYTFYYYDKYKKLEPTKTKLQTMQSNANDYRDSYKEICKYGVESLWVDSWWENPQRPAVEIIEYEDNYSTFYKITGEEGDSSHTISELIDRKCYTDGSTYECTWDTVYEQIEEIETKKNELETAIRDADSAAQTYDNMDYGSGDNQYNEAQWYYFASNGIADYSMEVLDKAYQLADALVDLKLMKNNCEIVDGIDGPNAARPNDYEQQIEDALEYEDYLYGYTKEPYSAGGAYLSLLDKLETSYNNGITKKYSAGNVTVSNSNLSVEGTLSNISTKFTEDYNQICNYIKALDTVIDGDGDKVKSLDEIANLADSYKTDYQSYKNEAYSGSNSGLHETCQSEIETDYENESGEINRNITRSDVQNFKQKLVNVRAIYQGIKGEMDEILFGSSSLRNISDYNGFSNELSSAFAGFDSPQINRVINEKADEVFKTLFKPSVTDELITIPSNTDNSAEYRLILKKGDDTYYDFMLSQGYNVNDLDSLENEVSNQQGKLDGWKKDAENAKNNTEEREAGADSVSNFDGAPDSRAEGGFWIGTTVSAFAELFKSLADLNGDSVRDAVYVTLYANEMFSYRTYEYEGKYDLLSDSDKADIDVGNATDKYAGVSEKWSSTDKKDTYNKSLTNQLINKDNNYAYGGELEYILYGGTAKANYRSAYEDIFAIRCALNLASGFQHFYTSGNNTTANVIQGVSTGISSATCGVIPAPVVKCVIIGLLSILESVSDMARLLKGLPVELYKKEANNWKTSFESATVKEGDGSGANGAPGTNSEYTGSCEPTLQYSDYLFLFTYFGFQGQNESMYERMGNVIEKNMQKRGNSDFSLDKSRILFKLEADMEVEALMLDNPLASDYNSDILEATDWRSFQLKMTRGY